MKQYILWILLLFLTINLQAFQPVTLVKTANNIRKAVSVSSKTISIGKTALQLGKCANAIPEKEIAKLAQIATKPNGLKEVNKILGKANYIGKFGSKAGNIILQDTYLRIAVKNGRLSSKAATTALNNFHKTPGFRSLLSKIKSSSFSQAKGHLRELEIALSAKQRGFSTVEFGRKFADGIKKANTDLDVLLSRNGKMFAIESKAYAGTVKDAMVKADAQSLLAFCKSHKGTTPVFCFETPPSRYAGKYLLKNKIRCIVGTPDEIATKLDILSTLYNKRFIKK
jgi:hypothetical protein